MLNKLNLLIDYAERRYMEGNAFLKSVGCSDEWTEGYVSAIRDVLNEAKRLQAVP